MAGLGKIFGSIMGAKAQDTVAIEFNNGNFRLACIKATSMGKQVVALFEKDVQNLNDYMFY